MSTAIEEVLKEALRLPPRQRAAVAGELLSSLHRPDAEIEAIWSEEVEKRVRAFDEGRIDAITEEEFFDELEGP